MTDLTTHEAAADTQHAHREQFIIEKRGVYYRPEAKGYTGLKREAGRYSFEEAAERVGPNGPDGSQDGLSMWREDEAPEYSSACYSDTRAWEEGRKKGAADAAAEIERLKREAEISAQSLRNMQSVREHEHKRAEAALAEIERLTALLEEATTTLEAAEDTMRLVALPSFADNALRGIVKDIGDRHGFGNVMATASVIWREMLEKKGMAGGEFTCGTCRSTADADHAKIVATLARIKEPSND